MVALVQSAASRAPNHHRLAVAVLVPQGYGFCEFADGAVVDGVIKALHNSVVDTRKITVKRADDESAGTSVSGSSA